VGAAAGLLYGLVFATGFYMPWFFTFFLLLPFRIPWRYRATIVDYAAPIAPD